MGTPRTPVVGAAGPDEAVPGGNPVSNIPADRAEGVFSLLKLTPHDQPSSMSDLITQHHQTRLANAQMYSNAAKTALHSQLLIQHGIDPDTGTRFDDPSYQGPSQQDQLARYQANYNEAWTNYKKLAGVDQNTKGALAKAEQILNHILGGGAMQSAPGAPSDQGRPGGMTPPPQAGGAGGGGVAPAAAGGGAGPAAQGMTPPPSPSAQADPNFALSAPMVEANTDFQQNLNRGLQSRKAVYQQDIQTRTTEAKKIFGDTESPAAQRYILTGTFPPFHGLQKSPLVDPDTGEPVIFDPMTGTYATQDGREVKNAIPQQKPQMVEVVMPNGDHAIAYEQYKKLTDQQGNALPDGTKKFYSQMADRSTESKTWKTVQQPDGSTALVPVVNESVTRRGGMAAPPAAGAAPAGGQGAGTGPAAPQGKTGFPGGVTPAKPSNATKSSPPKNAAAALGLPPGSKIVGGKVPPGVAKAYDTYNGSLERFNIMQDAVPKALKGDQQAMINLLYNHIGMTTGLQKGGRITQPVIDEAQNSAPWEATILKRIGVGNEFEMTPDLLRGVVLDPQTMHNMVGLAQDRVTQDYSAWQREIGSAKTGYGMTTPPPPTSPDIQSTSRSGGKPSSFKPF